MRRYDPSLIAIAVTLAGVAGFVDSLVFAGLGFFASFMSGNSTRLGVALGEGARSDAVVAASLLLAFLGGVVASTVIARRFPARRKPAVLLAATIVMALAALSVGHMPERLSAVIAAMAMGALNNVFARQGEVTIGVTYMTGSLVKLGQGLANALMGDADRWGWTRYLALWLGFAAGAVIGVGFYMRIGLAALWPAAAALAVVTLVVGTTSAGRPDELPDRE